MRRWAPMAVACAALVSAAPLTVPAEAADPPTVSVVWNMNESFGTPVMTDSGPRNLAGTVNPTGVVSGYSVSGATAYHWERRAPDLAPPSPERIITVPDDPMLDAGAGTFTIEIRYRTKENFGNIIQKGQAHSVGGQWKIQAPKGIPSCLFRGAGGRVATGALTPINDNEWHVLTCVKTPGSVTLYVDGEYRSRKNRDIGLMDNKKPVTIGGKLECDQVDITCDYFSGDIDYVKITKPKAGPVLDAAIDPRRIVVGDTFTVRGAVTDGASGEPYPGVPIHLFGQPKGSVGFVDRGERASTSSDGTFSFTAKPSATNEWYVATSGPSGGLQSPVTKVRVDGLATIHLTDKSVRAGKKVTFFGKVRPKSATVVKLQRKQSGEWTTKRKTTPDAGRYRINWKPKSKVNFRWRVLVSGPTFHADHSRKIILKVR